MTHWMKTRRGSAATKMLLAALLVIVHTACGANPASQPAAAIDGQPHEGDSEKGWFATGAELKAKATASMKRKRLLAIALINSHW
jgi:hypothetical protein